MKTQLNSWQQQLSNAVTCVDDLLSLVELQSASTQADKQNHFRLRVPRAFIERMEKGNPDDPLLKQVLPLEKENEIVEGYNADPLNEKKANKLPGLLHKYFGRVLLILTSGCAVNCRYCFRRHFPYHENNFSIKSIDPIIQYIKKHPEIYEVILSGGDPLIVKDEQLERLVFSLSQLSQLKYLRIHTRLPIMIPSRITDSLITILKSTRLISTVVIHCNHPQEIDNPVAGAIKNFRDNNIHVLNQTVLLKGINDNATILTELSHRLFSVGVLPYYLHLLDPVQGGAHFQINEGKAVAIMESLRRHLPGYLVPKLVKEVAGQPYKVNVSSAALAND